jgi:hypothetical protein
MFFEMEGVELKHMRINQTSSAMEN